MPDSDSMNTDGRVRSPQPEAPSDSASASEVAVVVVTHRSVDVIDACLAGLAGCRVIVIDNGSDDGTAERLRAWPEVETHLNADNVGFATAINQAFALVPDSHVLVLNPDVECTVGDIQALAGELERVPDAGIVAPRLLDPDGSVQHSARTFPTLASCLARRSLLGRTAPGLRILERHLAPTSSPLPAPVDWVLGAAMLIRRECIAEVGGFDEAFFLYAEDVDYCTRAWRHGWSVVYSPGVEMRHGYARSSRATLDLRRRAVREHWKSMARLAWRYPRAFLIGGEPRSPQPS